MAGREGMIATLADMGFGPNRAKRALQATDNRGVEPAMEWLLARADDDSLDNPLSEGETEEMEATGGAGEEAEEPKKPLTEEEKKAKMARLEELRVKKRAERLEREKKEAIEKEKKRVEDGKGMSEIRQALEEQEIRKLADLRRREKQEEKAAKAKILAQIEADKIARRAQFNMKSPEGAAAAPAAAAPPPPPVAAATSSPAAKKDYSEARIQIRQTNGQPLVHTFGVKEQLAAVRLYAEMNRSDGSTGPFKLMTNFPKKVFAEDDYENSLENLGLVPSAVLMMTK